MNTADTEIKRFKIIVIQSLKSDDLKTGKELYDGTLKWKNIISKDVLTEFYDVSSKEEFLNTIDYINQNLEEGDILTLQLEAHGCDKGIGFSNDDIIEWKEFQDAVRKVNITIGGLLIVCLAMCFGGATISTIDFNNRAPYLAIIAPFKDVPAAAVEEGFRIFYSDYNNLLDIANAMNKIQSTSIDRDGTPFFYVLSSEEIFDKTFDPNLALANYKRLVECHLTSDNSPENIAKTELEIKSKFIAIKNEYRGYYLFKDIINKKGSSNKSIDEVMVC